MKQSSVEFAVEKLEALIPSGNQLAIYAILEQAKAMHEQEIKDAFNMNTQCGIAIKPLAGVIKTFEAIDDEDYYNQTFNSKQT